MVGTAFRGALVSLLAAASLLALALVAAPLAGAAQRTDWTQLKTLNIAHQGGENEAPSNTMYAYERSLRLGGDMLEVDFHTTKDGQIVVLHDATVDRTTNGTGRVYDMTLKQVQALDAGYNFVPGEGTRSDRDPSEYPFRGVRTGERKPPPGFKRRDFRIPTLAEVMSTYPDAPINIEIKGAADDDQASYLKNAEALASYLNKLGRVKGIMVASFNDAALARFHELAPQIDYAPGVSALAGYALFGQPLPEGSVAFQVPLTYAGLEVVNKSFVDNAHANGIAVHPWTIDDEPTMRELLDLGVEGIMSAEPTRLEKVLCRTDTARPDRPGSFPGSHCSRNASLACEVSPAGVQRLEGLKRLSVTLARSDEFVGRCAGFVKLRAKHGGPRKRVRFNFGEMPPSEGGPSELSVNLRTSRRIRRAVRRGAKLRVVSRPYAAYPAAGRFAL